MREAGRRARYRSAAARRRRFDGERRPGAGATVMSDRHAISRAWSVWRNEGPRSFWFKLCAELGYHRLLVLERSLADPIPDFEPRLAVSVQRLDRGDLDDYLAARPDTPRTRVLERLDAGDACFVARHEGAVVASCWVATRRARAAYVGWDVELPAGVAYLYDAYTAPAHRGAGVAKALCLHQLRQLRAAGLSRATRMTLPWNRPALRLHTGCGFRVVGVRGRLELGSWRRDFERLPRAGRGEAR
jgi:ribosomal protein S18 acetylase RimI-like enzyme